MTERVSALVRRAGEMVRSAGIYRGEARVKPGDDNFVTEYDIAVQDFLFQGLRDILPGARLIGEESAARDSRTSEEVWIVDPIDGTTNFMHGLRHSAVAVALLRNGETVLASVYNPYQDELFTAEKGSGAFCCGSRMRVSGRLFGDAVIAFGTTPYDKRCAGLTFAAAGECFISARDVRRSGSAVLDLAYLACGRFDGFFEAGLSAWDFAAGKLLVEEAGGRITDFKGNPLPAESPSSVLAGNVEVYGVLKRIVGEARGLCRNSPARPCE